MANMTSAKKPKGFSLIEVAFVLILFSLAFVIPLSNGVVGKGNSTQYASTNAATRNLSRLSLTANSVVELALANNPQSGLIALPAGQNQETSLQSFGDYATPIYYKWLLSGQSASASGDKLTAATLQVFASRQDASPEFELATSVANLAQSYPEFVPPPPTSGGTGDPPSSQTASCTASYKCTSTLGIGACSLFQSKSPVNCQFGCHHYGVPPSGMGEALGEGNCNASAINYYTSVPGFNREVIVTVRALPYAGTITGGGRDIPENSAPEYAQQVELGYFQYHANRYGLGE